MKGWLRGSCDGPIPREASLDARTKLDDHRVGETVGVTLPPARLRPVRWDDV